MTVREVLQIGHPVLSACAEEIDPSAINTPEVQGWVDDLIDTMAACKRRRHCGQPGRYSLSVVYCRGGKKPKISL